MNHLKWEKCGRTFEFTDALDQVVPNKFVYKSYVGQKNVEQNSEYFPYIWDKEKRILSFGNCEIRLTDNQAEFWQKDSKLLGISLHPEIQDASVWDRKQSTVSGLRITEHITEDACDFITLAYDVETEDQKSAVEIKVGGSNRAALGFVIEAKQAGHQRLSIDYDGKGDPIQQYDFDDKPLPICAYRFGDCIWRWDRTEMDDHVIEQKVSITQLHLKEADYQAEVVERVKPDTWGPTETSDDCFDYYDYYDEYDNLLYQGNIDYECNVGWIWSSVTASGTADDGCKITVYVTECNSTPQGNLQISDEDAPVAWDATHFPSYNTSYHATTITWDETSTGSQDSPEIKTLIQLRFDDADWDSGDDMKVGWLDDGSSANNYLTIAAEENGSYTGGQLTIVYSTAAAQTHWGFIG